MTAQNSPAEQTTGQIPVVMPGPSLDLNIQQELAALRQGEAWQQTGINRKSLVRYPDFRISLIVLKANGRIEEHHNPGRISVQTVAGHIRMHADDKLFDLPLGKILVLDRAVAHDVEAVGEESAFLLPVAMPEKAAQH
jgi:quercetin dioxygenase-like cupin family protein